uniref:Uncharacterized protein n=1 Tax=Anopheles culicifacies TaxID=139723 RepID=A0A182MN23_9DIPT
MALGGWCDEPLESRCGEQDPDASQNVDIKVVDLASVSESRRSSCSEGTSNTSARPVDVTDSSCDGNNTVDGSVVREVLKHLGTEEPKPEQNACEENAQELDRIHKMTDVAHELGALRLIVATVTDREARSLISPISHNDRLPINASADTIRSDRTTGMDG